MIRNILNKSTITVLGISISLLFLFSSDFVLAQKAVDAQENKQEEVTPPFPDDEDSNIVQPPDLEDYIPEDPEINDNGKIESPFEVSISVGKQSAWNKKVEILIEITPLIDAQRTQISIDSGYGLLVEPKYGEFFPMQEGKSETFKAIVEPTSAGEYPITVSVTDWGYGRNYISSDRSSVTFDDSLLLVPRSSGYTFSVILKYLAYLLIFIVILVVAFFFGKYAITWLRVWLKPPEY